MEFSPNRDFYPGVAKFNLGDQIGMLIEVSQNDVIIKVIKNGVG